MKKILFDTNTSNHERIIIGNTDAVAFIATSVINRFLKSLTLTPSYVNDLLTMRTTLPNIKSPYIKVVIDQEGNFKFSVKSITEVKEEIESLLIF